MYYFRVFRANGDHPDQELWVEAPSPKALGQFVARISPPGVELKSEEISYKTWDQGLDAVLNENGIIIERGSPTLPFVGRES